MPASPASAKAARAIPWSNPPGREKIDAIGALDLALWDIKGKVLGRPVHSLLGGMVRNFCECYPTGGIIPGVRPGMSVVERARATMEAGFRAYRSEEHTSE